MPHRHRLAAGALLLASSTSLASPADRPPPRDDRAAPELLKLRDELFATPKKLAMNQLGRFRALCDADGYPLVGNVSTKGERVQPSEVCTEVRQHQAPKRST